MPWKVEFKRSELDSKDWFILKNLMKSVLIYLTCLNASSIFGIKQKQFTYCHFLLFCLKWYKIITRRNVIYNYYSKKEVWKFISHPYSTVYIIHEPHWYLSNGLRTTKPNLPPSLPPMKPSTPNCKLKLSQIFIFQVLYQPCLQFLPFHFHNTTLQ